MCVITKQKTKLAVSATVGISLAFLLLGISYAFFPNEMFQDYHTLDFGGLSAVNEVFWAIFGLGLAAFVALIAVGILLAVSRLKRHTTTIESTRPQ